jgi:hypothetical protein
VWVIVISVYVLLCAAHLAAGQCTSVNAIDVIRFPDVGDEMACVRESMVTIAALAIRAGPDESWKFVCVRPASAEAAALAKRAADVD